MASGDKFYLADKETLDEVKGKIGSTADTGGSSTAGSVFGKLNYLVSQLSSYLATIYSWINTLMGKVGNTNDSEGTATTGTVMGKLNYLVARMGSVYSWANNIFSRVGATTDTGGTTTAGTVMAKENAILAEVNKIRDNMDVTKEIYGRIRTDLNSTIGTEFTKSLDTLLSAKILCRGTVGTIFTIKHSLGLYRDIVITLTESSKINSSDLYYEIVPVPLGSYSISIDVAGTIMNATVNATAVGVTYSFNYSSYKLVQSFSSNGSFTVPAGVSKVYVTASGGGKGGTGGTGGQGTYTGSPKGGGFGGSGGIGGSDGVLVAKKELTVTPGQVIPVTIGLGGAGGSGGIGGYDRGDSAPYGEAGGYSVSGGATTFGSLLTVAGGTATSSSNSGGTGGQGSLNSSGYAGTSGNGRGGAGGTGGYGSGTNSTSGGTGEAGTSGSRGQGGGGGGGGGGCLDDWRRSRGGDGGTGGTGGNGYLEVYTGISII